MSDRNPTITDLAEDAKMPGVHYAHTLEGAGREEGQPLGEHLDEVARRAAEHANAFGSAAWGSWPADGTTWANTPRTSSLTWRASPQGRRSWMPPSSTARPTASRGASTTPRRVRCISWNDAPADGYPNADNPNFPTLDLARAGYIVEREAAAGGDGGGGQAIPIPAAVLVAPLTALLAGVAARRMRRRT